MSRNLQLPQGKRVHVYRSGDARFLPSKVHFNPMRYKKMEYFLNEIGEKVPIVGAVRSIHTPNTGTVIKDLDQLTKDGKYVAAGTKGFISIPGGYESIGKLGISKTGPKKTIRKKVDIEHSRRIFFYKNGDNQSKASSVVVSDSNTTWTNLLDKFSSVLKFPVKRVFDSHGRMMDSVNELIKGECYVGAEDGESFRKVEYPHPSIRKFTVHNPGIKLRPTKSFEDRSSGSEIQDSESKVASSSSIQSVSSTRSKSRKKLQNRRNQLTDSPEVTEDISEVMNEGFEDDINTSSTRSQSLPRTNSRSSFYRIETAKSTSSSRHWGSQNDIDHLYESLSRYEKSDDEENAPEDEEYHVELPENYEEDSIPDSGHGSLLTYRSRPDSVFTAKAKHRPSTTMIVDYDTDNGGVFRAKSSTNYGINSRDVLEDSKTKIEMPIDLMEAKEVMEEVY